MMSIHGKVTNVDLSNTNITIIIIITIKIITIIICYARQGDRLPNVGQDPLRRGNVEGGKKSKKRLKG